MIDDPNICVCNPIRGFYRLRFKTDSCELDASELDACQDDGIQAGREGRLMLLSRIGRWGRESLRPGVCGTSYTQAYTPTAPAYTLTCPLSSSLAYCLTPSGIPRILLSSFMRNNKLILLTHSTNCFLAHLRTAAPQLISCELGAHYCSY